MDVIIMKHKNINKLNWKDLGIGYVKEVPFDEKDLNCKGTKFQVLKYKPGTKIPSHYHKEAYEIFYIREGKGIISFNGKDIRCKPDDFFLCEPNDLHGVVNDTEEDFVILVFKTNLLDRNDFYWEDGTQHIKK